MSTKDKLTKAYMKDNAVFADAFNYYVYSGRQVIKPGDLRELDTAESAVILEPPDSETIHPGTTSEQRYRDILKSAVLKRQDDTIYVVLGIENQSDIHYAMPVRSLIYDGLQYGKQVQNKAADHRKNGRHLSKSEFLSGFGKQDRLTPVVTLVVYFGVDRWDGARSIHEMMDVNDAELLRYVQDYRINLIEPAALSTEELDKFATSLREVLGYIKYLNDKDKLISFITATPDKLIDAEAARVINIMTKTHIDIPEDVKEINMCKAIEDLINDSKAEGRSEGITQEKDLRVRRYLMLHNNPQEAATLFELPLDNVIAISKELGG